MMVGSEEEKERKWITNDLMEWMEGDPNDCLNCHFLSQ